MPKEKQGNQGFDIHWESDEKAQYMWEKQKEKEKEAQEKKDKEETYNSGRNYDPLNFYLPGE